ncbi:imelysin family protein [Phytopseudomonas daroniae]|uniref:imelysin family protein n=1 Tax=Phytopseudomonas daroniae TaxID=2487519 RepID=UPI0010385212|nr:imelysin family protein [Pseudomonas daroniae]TBU72611.1 imelysin [Pseudomonas daroniae]
MIRSPLTIALLGMTLAACSPADPQATVSAALAEGVLLPAHSTWREANAGLATSSKAFCAGDQDLSAARQAFLTTQSAWAGLQPLVVGPLAEGNRAWQVQFWPDKKNLVARQVQALVKSKPQLSPADLEKSSVVVQGLTAYEYLIYDPEIDLQDSEQKARYCPLLVAIGEHQQALANTVLEQWQAKDGALSQFKTFPNERYAEAGEAISDILRTQITAIDSLKKKLGAPMGRQSKGLPQPYQAEAWRSQASLANIGASLAGAERIWRGANKDGIQALLGSDQNALKQRIDAAYADTRQKLTGLQRPLGELLGDEAGSKALNEFYDSLNVLHRLHDGELARALGIQLGFNANDGD